MNDTLILFDIETAGLDMHKHDIIQLAAAAYSILRGEIIDEFEQKLLFDAGRADKETLDINGYTPEDWASAVLPRTAAMKFSDWLRPHCAVRRWSDKKQAEYFVARGCGYNAVRFDQPWLAEMFRRLGLFLPLDIKVLDLLQLAMWKCELEKIDLPDHKQETVCRHFGIEYEAHEALADVRAMALLITKLTQAGGEK